MSRSFSINLYLRLFSIAIYGKFDSYYLLLFKLFPGLLIAQRRSINYVLYFGSVKVHKHCLYWNVFSTSKCRKIIFNCLLLENRFCWSVNCMIRIRTFHNVFLTSLETEAKFIFEGYIFVIYGKLNLNFSVF